MKKAAHRAAFCCAIADRSSDRLALQTTPAKRFANDERETKNQSTLAPESFTTLPHLAVSVLMNSANWAGFSA